MQTAHSTSRCALRAGARLPAVWALPAVLAVAGVLTGCASRKLASEAPAPRIDPPPKQEASDPEELGGQLERCRADLEAGRAELTRARQETREAQQRAATAEERYEALRREVDRAIDEVLASKASLRGVNNRALAISRIAEVRVQMQSVGARHSPDTAGRLRTAERLLARADRALEDANYGGAAYLADRAAESITQARTSAEVASRHKGESAGLIPIVPPRMVEVAVVANLRSGPDTARPRVGQAKPGTQLRAVSRLGEWFEVETGGGRSAWIHRGALR